MTGKIQRIHAKAPDNWVNDPNGLIYYKGYYHLFYQYFPYAPRWGTMHWGHAVSRDLVNWEHRGIALFPTKRGDENGCFSGSAVEKDGRLCLIYTGVRYEPADPEDIHVSFNEQFESCQMMISSEDGFRFDNWKDKEMVLPPLTDPQIGDRTHTRDPKVWREGDSWYMILGSTREKKQGRVLIFKSRDLRRWTYVSQTEKGPEYGWMWECPDYVKTPGGSVLFVSAMGLPDVQEKEKNHVLCFPAKFEAGTGRLEIADRCQLMDWGMDLYAPQTTLDREGRRILMAWVRMPKPSGDGWIGMFSSPRVVEMEGNHVYLRMHPAVRAAYSRKISETSQAPDGYRAVFDLKDGQQVDVGGFRIGRRNRRIYTDRSAVYPRFAGAHLISETPELSEEAHLEVLADENLIEVFINDGEHVISNAVYGLGNWLRLDPGMEIELYALG